MKETTRSVLLTGASGTLGSELALRLLREPDVELTVLTRHPARAAEWLTDAAPGRQVRVVEHDFTIDGGSAADLARQVCDVTHVIHAAADTRWNRPLEAARLVNVGGTRTMLDVAARLPSLRWFCQVSTAFVGNEAVGVVTEQPAGTAFANTYEQSKAEAEAVVLEAALPCAIARTSIIVGRTTDGEIVRPRLPYDLASIWNRGGLPVLVGAIDATADLIPVDFAAEYIANLAEVEAKGLFHLVAGKRAPELPEMLAGLVASLNVLRLADGRPQLPAPRVIDPAVYERLQRPLFHEHLSARQRRIMRTLEWYRPHLEVKREFDNSRLRGALGERFEPVPPLVDYVAALTRWWWETAGHREVEGSLATPDGSECA